MGRWLVTQNNAQFAVDDLDQLRSLARAGKVEAGDMVQPPGATDWLYASEVPELKGVLSSDFDDDLAPRGSGLLVGAVAAVLIGVIALGLVGVLVLGGIAFTSTAQVAGEGALAYSEMIVTADGARLLAEPDPNSRVVTALKKDSTLSLLAKRGAFYKARAGRGEEGWVAHDAVLPLYLLGGGDVRAEFDPLYNPDAYVSVRNASWLQIDKKKSQLTVFRFQVENTSRYPMTGLVILATIKDSRGTELEKVEIPVEGDVPPHGFTMVGTWRPEDAKDGALPRLITEYTFGEMTAADPDLTLQYTDGVEVEMKTADFTEATVELLEVRGVPR